MTAGSNLVVTFSESIALGTGNITLRNLTDSTQVVIAVTDGTQVSLSGAVLTINPVADLAGVKNYAIRIDAGALKDLANNPFAGIADDTTWNLTTATVPQAVTVAAVTGSHGGDEYATGMTALVNGSGMTRPDLADPSTWTVSYNNYPDEWMGNYLVGAGNSKLAWVAFDLGASTALHQLYLWNIRYSGGVAGTATYNLYYADSPTVALPAQPNKGAYSVTGLTPQGDYDFTSGGWTKFNTSGTLSAPQAGNSIVDLSGISARYIALEILTNHGDTYLGGRVGFLETAFTRAVTPGDTTPPTLTSSAIVDDKSGGPVTVNTLVTYTVTFSEDMDASTVTAADFGNAGTAAVTIGTVTETTPGCLHRAGHADQRRNPPTQGHCRCRPQGCRGQRPGHHLGHRR